MSTPAGRPNAQNKVLNEDGTFTTTWYRLFVQIWQRSGGSDDGLSDLEEEVTEDVEVLQGEVDELNEKVDALEDSVSDIEALPIGGEDEEVNDVTPSIIASQPYDDTLAAISETEPTTDEIIYYTGTDEADVTALTPYARTLIDDSNAATARATLDAEQAFSKNTAFNKNFGLVAGTVLEGDTTASDIGGVPTSRNLTAGTGLDGGGDLSADRTFDLANTAVTPGSFTNTDLTVDAQGRITSATNGTAPGSTTFDALTDTPATKVGQAGKATLVNIGETALEYVDLDAVYEPLDATILKSADIGITVQAHSAVLDATTASFLIADETKLDFISVTQPVDLDTMESDITTNNAKVSNVTTDLSYDAPTRTVASSDGTDAVITEVVAAGDSGLMTGTDKTKLDGITAGADPTGDLDDLTNVTITANVDGEILRWTGSAWINNTLAEAGIEPADGTILKDADIGGSVQAFDADLDVYAANPLTAAELGELQNINSVTISNAQWVFLGNFNQALTTTSNVSFGTGTFSGILKTTDTTDATAINIGALQSTGGFSLTKSMFCNGTIHARGAMGTTFPYSSADRLRVGIIGALPSSSDPGAYIGWWNAGASEVAGSLIYIARPSANGDHIWYVGTGVNEAARIDAITKNFSMQGKILGKDTTDSTSPTTGSVQAGGGFGCVLDAFIGGDLHVQGTAAIITSGSGSPEGVVTAPIGSVFTRTDGGAGTSRYWKESGTGNTGWVAY